MHGFGVHHLQSLSRRRLPEDWGLRVEMLDTGTRRQISEKQAGFARVALPELPRLAMRGVRGRQTPRLLLKERYPAQKDAERSLH